MCALQAMDVDVARAAFIRLRDVRSVELVNQVAAGLAAGTPHNLLRADVAAWQGDFDQAAKLYVAEGQLDKVRYRQHDFASTRVHSCINTGNWQRTETQHQHFDLWPGAAATN